MYKKTQFQHLFKKIRIFFSKPVVKISMISLFAGIVLLAAVLYYLSMREKTRNPYDFIPENSIAVLQINQTVGFVSLVNKNNLFSGFENILQSNTIQNQLLYFDSLFNSNEQLVEAWNTGIMLISAHQTGASTCAALIVKPLPHPGYDKKVYAFLNETARSCKEVYSFSRRAKIYQCSFPVNGELYICVRQGVCLVSNSLQLIKKAVENADSKKSLMDDSDFKKVYETAGKNCIANCFINYDEFYRLMSSRLNNEVLKDVEVMNHFAAWSAFDLHEKETGLLMNGYTVSGIGDEKFLNVFTGNVPQKTDIVQVLPQNTVSFVWMGFENYPDFREKFKTYLAANSKIKEFNDNLTGLNRRAGVDNIQNLIFPFIDNQMALFSIPLRSAEGGIVDMAVFKILNSSVFARNLSDISKAAAKKSEVKSDTVGYRNAIISYIPADYMLFDLFGNMFSTIDMIYYTIYDDYWVVGPSQEALKEYLNFIIAGRTIDKLDTYLEFSQSVTEEASIYLYASPRRMKQQVSSFWTEPFSTLVLENIDELNNFEAIGIQISVHQDMFMSTVSMYSNETPSDDEQTGWEVTFEGTISSGPWFVDVAEQTEKNIVLFDAFNQMYYFSNKGELLWKIPLEEKPVSKVYSIDALKNGKIQYLFSTENNIYIIDRLGKPLDHYPMKLPKQSSSPVNVMDYDKSREYRMLYTGIDNVIYNFNSKGEQTPGWQKPEIKAGVTDSIRHLRLINTDFLVVKDSENILHFFNRKGESLFTLDDIIVNPYSLVYTAPKLCKCFVTSTMDGQIAKISTSGDVQLMTIHDPGPGHVFIYEDIDSDGVPDFIFIDNGQVFVFGQDEQVKYKITVASDAGRKTGFIKESPFGPVIFMFSSDGTELYLMNKEGRIAADQLFESSGSADFRFIKENGQLLITTAKGNSLKMYILQ